MAEGVNLWDIVERQVEQDIGKNSYLEHLIDLNSHLILKLSDTIDPTLLDAQTLELLEYLKQFNVLSSVAWDNMQNPFEAYKLPMALDKKKYIRDIQKIYLSAKLKEEGLI